MKALCISAVASKQGKTLLTTALLHHYQNSVRPFKIGPDFIDPQFHESICGTPSVNLDTFMMNSDQVQWMFAHYSDKSISILEGVMGFYDGMDKGCSAYDVSKLLGVPTLLLLDGSSSYITISAVLQGLVNYKENNTIKAVVLNRLSSDSHYQLIKNQIESDFGEDIAVCGWIKKELPSLKETHLGLDLGNRCHIAQIASEVLQNIDMDLLDEVAQNRSRYFGSTQSSTMQEKYPFEPIEKVDKKLAIVKDRNFSFLYHDNIEYLKEIFAKVVMVNASNDEPIPDDVDSVFIPGGYVETDEAYATLGKAETFKASLRRHAKNRRIYAECAGLLYLGNRVDEKEMSGILDLDFMLHSRFQRMGYYYAGRQKGHAFHYTNIIGEPEGVDILSKRVEGRGSVGSWQKGKIFGTYLHAMFRGNKTVLQRLVDGIYC